MAITAAHKNRQIRQEELRLAIKCTLIETEEQQNEQTNN